VIRRQLVSLGVGTFSFRGFFFPGFYSTVHTNPTQHTRHIQVPPVDVKVILFGYLVSVILQPKGEDIISKTQNVKPMGEAHLCDYMA
jgi:hypothetical protein